MFTKSDADLRQQFEDIVTNLKDNGTDVRFIVKCGVGPDCVEGVMDQHFAFYRRGYHQAKLDFIQPQTKGG